MIKRQDNNKFELVSPYKPAGDQQQAIDQLTAGFQAGEYGGNRRGGCGNTRSRSRRCVAGRIGGRCRPTRYIGSKTLRLARIVSVAVDHCSASFMYRARTAAASMR